MRRMMLFVTAALILQASIGSAHNLFVHLERQLDGPDLIDVFFEHAPYPGDGKYNGPIIERGRTWVRTPGDEEPIAHSLAEITRRGKTFLQGATRTKAPRSIEHSCKWGIYHGQLDYFHGKYLDVKTIEQARQLGRAPDLPLDLAPRLEDEGLSLQVLWQGKPCGGVTVFVWPPGGKEKKYKASEQGVVRLPKPKGGLYSFATVVTFKEKKGEFEGQPYQGIMHGVTLTMRWPLK
jgi:hypothetical protein